MGIKIETWTVAYRKRKQGFLDDCSDFKIISNGHKGWYADPFLFDYKDETYLFVEYFSYKLNRGVIAYSKFNKETNSFGSYKEIISEKYHLSYPLVFEFKNEIYMLPEASESDSLYFYKAIDFPEKWKKTENLLSGIKLVDTTPFFIDNSLYAIGLDISNESFNLLLMRYEANRFTIVDKIENCDMSLSRPGGRIIVKDDKLVAITQDCKEAYGKAVNFIEVTIKDNKLMLSEPLKKITPNDVGLIKAKQADGIHTYNFSKDLEVVDLKYYKRSYYRGFLKLISLLKK